MPSTLAFNKILRPERRFRKIFVILADDEKNTSSKFIKKNKVNEFHYETSNLCNNMSFVLIAAIRVKQITV